MRLSRTVLAAAAAASLLGAPAASAATNCFGPRQMYFCLTTPEPTVGWRTECVYLGGTQCTNVRVPTAGTTGELNWYCGGTVWTCASPGS